MLIQANNSPHEAIHLRPQITPADCLAGNDVISCQAISRHDLWTLNGDSKIDRWRTLTKMPDLQGEMLAVDRSLLGNVSFLPATFF
jgi:hypothetical protein